MTLRRAAAFAASFVFCSTSIAQTQPIRIASWNLGWHVAQAEVPNWIDRCNRTYRKDVADGVWKPAPAGTQGSVTGWNIRESRAKIEGIDLSVMPPCGVYQAPNRDNIPVTIASYANRTRQIARFIAETVRPDVIAFQEVSGSAAIVEALGAAAGDYAVCSFDGKYKVQRLAFAWRKSMAELVEHCAPIHELSLPGVSPANQVRPGYTVGLRVRGQLLRLLNIHMKSGCVSPLDGGRLGGGADQNKAEACDLLQRQIPALEASIEQLTSGANHVVVLGDFNRNIWHELHQVRGAEARRSDGAVDLTAPLPPGVTVSNLLAEVNDGKPATSRLTLQSLTCAGSHEVEAVCAQSKTRVLRAEESRLVSSDTGLGCRNGIGLDHFLVSDALRANVFGSAKLPLGKLGMSLSATAGNAEPLLAISDHCPIVLTVDVR